MVASPDSPPDDGIDRLSDLPAELQTMIYQLCGPKELKVIVINRKTVGKATEPHINAAKSSALSTIKSLLLTCRAVYQTIKNQQCAIDRAIARDLTIVLDWRAHHDLETTFNRDLNIRTPNAIDPAFASTRLRKDLYSSGRRIRIILPASFMEGIESRVVGDFIIDLVLTSDAAGIKTWKPERCTLAFPREFFNRASAHKAVDMHIGQELGRIMELRMPRPARPRMGVADIFLRYFARYAAKQPADTGAMIHWAASTWFGLVGDRIWDYNEG